MCVCVCVYKYYLKEMVQQHTATGKHNKHNTATTLSNQSIYLTSRPQPHSITTRPPPLPPTHTRAQHHTYAHTTTERPHTHPTTQQNLTSTTPTYTLTHTHPPTHTHTHTHSLASSSAVWYLRVLWCSLSLCSVVVVMLFTLTKRG